MCRVSFIRLAEAEKSDIIKAKTKKTDSENARLRLLGGMKAPLASALGRSAREQMNKCKHSIG